MSSFLYVVLAPPANPEIVNAELRSFVVGRCAGRVLNNALQQFRFNLTTVKDEVYVEPYLGSVSLAWTLSDRKKRSTAEPFFQAMFDWAAQQDIPVQIEVVQSRPRRADVVTRFGSLEELLQTLPKSRWPALCTTVFSMERAMPVKRHQWQRYENCETTMACRSTLHFLTREPVHARLSWPGPSRRDARP